MGRKTMFENELRHVMYDNHDGLRTLQFIHAVNQNRLAKGERHKMSANTFEKYAKGLIEKGEVARIAVSYKEVIYKPTPKMDSVHARFMIGLNICAALMQLGETETTVFEGVQHASKEEMKTVSAFLREAADLIDAQKL